MVMRTILAVVALVTMAACDLGLGGDDDQAPDAAPVTVDAEVDAVPDAAPAPDAEPLDCGACGPLVPCQLEACSHCACYPG